MAVIVFDIGASKTRIGLSRNKRSLSAVKIIPTAPLYRHGMQMIITAGRMLSARDKISKAVGGFAGPLNQQKTKPIQCLNRDWVGRPLASDLARGWQTKILLENDAAMNGLGEATVGAGRGYPIVGFVTVSTGVNGVRIVHGRIDQNAFGYELGHLIVTNSSGRSSTLQQEISGLSLQRRYGRLPETIKRSAVWTAAENTLGPALVNLALAWSPNVMVIGGPVVKSMSLSRLRRKFRAAWKTPKTPPRIIRGTLRSQSGLFGALALARNKS